MKQCLSCLIYYSWLKKRKEKYLMLHSRRDRELHALLFTISVWVLLRPLLTITSQMQETGPTAYSPYPRRPQLLTLCRYRYKGSTFSSVILRPWVSFRNEARTFDLPHCSPALFQLSQPDLVYHLLLWMAFTKFTLLTLPSFAKIHILSILF